MHWFLMRYNSYGDIVVLDPTAKQFKRKPSKLDYIQDGIGCGFLTKRPSKRARELMKRMVWQ